MKYFKKVDEGLHHDWGGYPTYWLEANEFGYITREISKYPNGNILSYDETHNLDEHGALSDYIDSNESFWAPYEITKAEFEHEWNTISPLNRNLRNV